MSRHIWLVTRWNLVKNWVTLPPIIFIANKIDQPKIAVINCEAFEVCVQRRKGFEEVLKTRVPGAQIVANQEGTVLDKAISVGEKLIISTPDLNAIMGESGGATLGAVKAVRNQNQAGKLLFRF